jgi:hypothetical protein
MGIKEKTVEGLQNLKDEGKVLKGEKSKDKIYESSRDFATEDEARSEFVRARQRLFDVNAWSLIPGIANARFRLFNKSGEPLEKSVAQVDDFIEIDLPGPLPMYWVRVVDVVKGDDEASFTVQPTYDPTDIDDRSVTDHFFQDKARSVFCVERRGTNLSAAEIGINETINNEGPEAGSKAVINTLVSEGGWAGFQQYQWKNLTEYLVGLKSAGE